MNAWIWVLISFLCGSMPFSYWIGKYAMRRDIRAYGDGNPGVFNVIRAGSFSWGGLALILEITKGAFPVGMAAYIFQYDGLALAACALAPPLGHAFSPFLRFRGGKAIAAIAGMWIGLALWVVIFVACGLLVFWSLMLTSSAWAVMVTMFCLLFYLLALSAPQTWLAAWFGTLLLLIFRHRHELTTLPGLRLMLRNRNHKSLNPTGVEPSPGGPIG